MGNTECCQEKDLVIKQDEQIPDVSNSKKLDLGINNNVNYNINMNDCDDNKPSENMPLNKSDIENKSKSAPAKYTKFVNKQYVKGDLVLILKFEGHLSVFS